MKRYKQVILSNFFVTTDDSGIHHLVEANLDIELPGDRTLCTEVLHGERSYEVLTNHHLHNICMICSAILDRRIYNMPKERKHSLLKSGFEPDTPESQLCLLTVSMDFGDIADEQEVVPDDSPEEQSPQIDLFF